MGKPASGWAIIGVLRTPTSGAFAGGPGPINMPKLETARWLPWLP